MRTILTTVVLVCGASLAFAQTDFSWRGPIGSGQTLEVRGVNGEVNATVSGSGDAEVYARKSANRSDPELVRVAVVPACGRCSGLRRISRPSRPRAEHLRAWTQSSLEHQQQ